MSPFTDRPEIALAGPEPDGDDTHAHLVNQARGKHLATDAASDDLDDADTRGLLRLGPLPRRRRRSERRRGVPAL